MSRTLLLVAGGMIAVLALGQAAVANDSVAAAETGGLVLKQTRAVAMVSEDLYISPTQVRVRYVFRNRTRTPVRTLVAFPMPDRNLAESDEGDTAWPSDFSTVVDGRPVRMQVERKALVRGVDRSALLRSLRVPFVTPNGNTMAQATEAMDRLPRAQQDRLVRLGLAEAGTYDAGDGVSRRHLEARWTVRETWHWEQVFPAGRNVIVEHRYTPGAGGAAGSYLHDAENRRRPWGREQIARYCVDNEIIAAAERLNARVPRDFQMVSETWLSYVLTTGANWAEPIGDFRLVVDKGSPENIVSFCEQGIRRISPTRFEVRHRNWRPTRDLHILILVPRRENG